MAISPVSKKRLCEQCKEDANEIKARTLCYECQKLLCKQYSNYHQRLKITKDHNLIELFQFDKKFTSLHDPLQTKETSSAINKDELGLDFLELVTLTEHTVMYQGAQAAVLATLKLTGSKRADNRRLKATKCLEFSVKRPEDKKDVFVTGVLCVSHNVVVVGNGNNVLKLFDRSGTYLSYTELNSSTWGITCVGDSTFATCGDDNTVNLWTVREQTVGSHGLYHVDHKVDGIHYNGAYYSVLHRNDNTVTVLDGQGRQVRKIIIKGALGKKFTFGFDAHMNNDTNNIYVPCENEYGVLCMTIEGRALWFTPLSRPWGITEIQGTLCVADDDNNCVHMMTKEGEYVRKLLDKEDLGGRPDYVCYGQDGKFYVSYISFSDSEEKISVYAFT